MRESQHEPVVEVGKTEKIVELCESGWGWPISNQLYLGCVHMHTPLINDVPHILNMGHTKSAFLQIGRQFVSLQGLKDLSDTMYVLFPTMDED